jgi:hypothetical protein
MFFGILFNAFAAMGEISQMYSQRPIIVCGLIVANNSKNISRKHFTTRQQMPWLLLSLKSQ